MSDGVQRVDVDAIRARADAAAPGPWRFSTDYRLREQQGLTVAQFFDQDGDEYPDAEENAAFLRHARTDVPALLDALAAAEAENARLREQAQAGILTATAAWQDGGLGGAYREAMLALAAIAALAVAVPATEEA